MVKPTNQETTAIETILCYLQFPRRQHGKACGATGGSARLDQEVEGVKGNSGQEHLLWPPQERKAD